MAEIFIRHATPADAEAFYLVSRDTFLETFGHLYKPEDLKSYLDATYAPVHQLRELQTSDYIISVAETDGKLVGFVMTGPCKLPVENPLQPAQELYRLYILRDYQGNGLGKRLMDVAMAQMASRKPASTYLGVWQENTRAQRLYASYGFKICGEYLFPVGEHMDHEFIMRLERSA